MKALLSPRDKPLILPGVYDVLSAIVAERAGAEAVFLSGYALSASSLGLPDLGYLSIDRVREMSGAIASRLKVPILVDADTGFGSALQVIETTRSLIRAGAGGLFLEDQKSPKRCGHMRGKELASRGEYLGKLRAAAAARGEEDFLIVARTDAIAVAGLDEAICRANEARKAGADLVFIEAPEDEAMLREIASKVPGPKLINLVEGGRTPLLESSALFELGFTVHLYPVTGLYAATAALRDAYRSLLMSGSDRRPAADADSSADPRALGNLDGSTSASEGSSIDFQAFAELLDLEGYFATALLYREDDPDEGKELNE